MKLIVSVVSTDDSARLVEALTAQGFTSTLMSSTGGFLRKGNDTVLIGVADDRVEDVLCLIKATCQPHSEEDRPQQPTAVRVGAATVFVLGVDQHALF